jgi:hypothetical protein
VWSEEVHFIELLDREREKQDLVRSGILQWQCRAPHRDGPCHPSACGWNPLVLTEQALQGLPPQAFGLCAGEALAEGRLHGVEAAGPGGQRRKVQPHQGPLPDDRAHLLWSSAGKSEKCLMALKTLNDVAMRLKFCTAIASSDNRKIIFKARQKPLLNSKNSKFKKIFLCILV